MHPMAVMPMVIIHLSKCDLRSESSNCSQSKSEATQWFENCLG